MKTHARVVVIGGGIFGVSLLYHLTKHGWSDVVLVEKNELTAGSTWHAAGLCTHFGHHLSVMRMRANSAKLYRSLEAETGQPTGFNTCGAVRMTARPERLDEFRHAAALGRWIDVDFEIIGPGELAQLFPLMHTWGLLGAIYEPTDGHVDPSQATQALAKGARDRGGEIYRHNPVLGIARRPSGEWQVSTRDGEITAEIAVNAAGAWARELGEMVGLDLPIVPMLHQYLVTDDMPEIAAIEDRSRLPLVRDHDESWYLRRERDGLLFGAYQAEAVPWSVDGMPADFGMDLLPPELDRIELIMAAAMRRVPALADAGIKTFVNGPITFTPDANPLIGPAPALPNFWIAAGSCMGVGEGAGAGDYLAQWMIDGEPQVDLWAFDPRRFGAWVDRDYRVAKASESFAHQFAVHYPHEERPGGRPQRKTPIYDRLAHSGAVFGAVYGWERANWFAGDEVAGEERPSYRRTNWFGPVGEECRRLAAGVGVLDLSAFSKLLVSGAGAETFLERLYANRLPRRVGGIGLVHCLTPRGGVQCEFTVTRLSAQRFYLVCAAVAQRHHLAWLDEHRTPADGVHIEDLCGARGVLAVAGPRSRELLQRLTDFDLSSRSFAWLTAKELTIAGVDVLALRVSYAGELGWELHHPIDRQLEIYDALKEQGHELGIADVGMFAMESMRIEKGYRGWGTDLSVETTPLEAGLERFVKLDKGEFIGRDALLDQLREGLSQRLVCLALDVEDADASGNEPVTAAERTVGIVTSAAYGHRVGRSLALAYVESAYHEPDTRLAVENLGQSRPAEVVADPVYDPTNHRPRM